VSDHRDILTLSDWAKRDTARMSDAEIKRRLYGTPGKTQTVAWQALHEAMHPAHGTVTLGPGESITSPVFTIAGVTPDCKVEAKLIPHSSVLLDKDWSI